MSDWQFKNEFPDLSGSKLIAFDTETKDPNLLTQGPGGIRRDGFICGFSVASDDGWKGYFPIQHSEGNVPDRDKAVSWLKQQLNCGVPIVGANLLYDCEMVKSYFGFDIKSVKYDVQVSDPILDENWPSYRLNEIAKRRLGLTKDEDLLYTKGAEFLGFKSRKDNEAEAKAAIAEHVKSNLWKLPASLVGAYGEADAALPIAIFKQQEKEMREQGLWPIFELECKVLDLLLAMRFQGVRVDMDKAEIAAQELEKDLEAEMEKIRHRVGFTPDIWSAESLGKACDVLGLPYQKTAVKINKKTGKEAGGKPSFESEWLAAQEHPLFKMFLNARQIDRCGSVYIRDKILGMAINGRVHTQYYQVKNDRGGTTSGRFSSSNPNLQQVPSRNERLATKVRSLFIAEPGAQWVCMDVKAQEPRFTVHYASLLGLRGAERVRDQYRNDPATDYHQYVADITGIERKTAKSINLGLAYGMGTKKFAEKYGKTPAEARDLFDIYHEKLPYIKQLTRHCENVVKQRGYLKTFLGRHCHFNLYGPPNFFEGMKPLHKEEAIKEYGFPISQYFTYRSMNRLIQGSSADMIKKCMIDCYEAGYLCNLTVHDELDFSNITSEKQIKEIHDIMVNAVKLEVPVLLDVEVGPNWGELTKVEV